MLNLSHEQSTELIAHVHKLPALGQCGVCLVWCVMGGEDTDIPSIVQVQWRHTLGIYPWCRQLVSQQQAMKRQWSLCSGNYGEICKDIQGAPFIVITDNVINRVMLSHLWIPVRTNTTTCGKFCLMWSCYFFVNFTTFFPRNFIIPLPLYHSLEVTVHSSVITVHRVGICWRKTCQLGEGGGIPASLSLLHNKTHPHLTQFIYQFCFGIS